MKEGKKMSKLFEVLYTLNQKTEYSQRDLSRICELSIGKINNLIREAEEKKYIVIESNKMKHTYQLTDKGMDALDDYFTKNSHIKMRINTKHTAPVTTAVILAAGKRLDFNKPVAFLEIDEKTLIERTIRTLFDNDIENIIIVTGYKSEYFAALTVNYPKIKLVHNEAYGHTGTMKSLSLVKDLVDDDFLLLESDIIFESKAIKRLIAHPERDCIIITNESGSGDEAFVEIRNGYIYNMTKDKHQLNKIDGEMIGLSKISFEMFKKMMVRFKDNKNPYLNYEYMLMDIGRKYKIGFEKLGDLVWWEFDTKHHYEMFKKDIYRRLYHQEKEWQEVEVKETISSVLDIKPEEITEIGFVGGLTNTSYKVTIKGKNYIARIPGSGTEEMINRILERKNCVIANQLGLDAKIIYINADNGVKIAEFIEGSEALTAAMTKREAVMEDVTKLLKRLHQSGVLFENDFNVFKEIEKYEKLIHEVNGFLFDDYHQTKQRVMRLEKMLDQLGREHVACHNDTGSFNILKDKNERFYLIDWEYAGNNDPVWDLAAHALESEFNKEEETLLLQKYFETTEVDEKDKTKLLLFQICQDFLWSIWTCIKEAKGDDFGTYGIDRYSRSKQTLDELEAKLNGEGKF